MALDPSNGLRDALIHTLDNILSPDCNVRKAAEDHVKILEVTEEFGVHLVEFTLDRNAPQSIRQLASVLLKQYVGAHWNKDSEKLRLPICSELAKARIRELLPMGLQDPLSKIRTSVAYAISAIAHWDWPEEWPSLFDILMNSLKNGDEVLVHGAMRVLTEFSRDLCDQHVPHVTPVILPEMYRIFCDEEKYSIRTRGRAVEIFGTLVSMIAIMSSYHKSMKSLFAPSLPVFTEALVKGLQTPDGFHSDSGLKKEILSALTILLKNVPKFITPYLQEVVGPVWNTLTNCATTYVNTIVNAREEADDPTDSDGEVMGFETLIFTIFEFVHVLLETSKCKAMSQEDSSSLIYYLLTYMQVTEDQISNWTSNPDAFVEDEDEDSFAYSVRISAQDLLKVMGEELECCPSGLVEAVNKLLERGELSRVAGDPLWWKHHEAVMLGMGISRDILLPLIKNKQLDFDLSKFMDTVVLANLNTNYSPFLSGRALWCGSRFAAGLNKEQVIKFIETTVASLNLSPCSIIRVSAVRALWGFCEFLKASNQQAILFRFLPGIFDGLINMATQASSEVLSLILETFSILVGVNPEFTTTNVGRISTLCLAVFIKANNDPVLVQLVQHVVGELCSNRSCTETVQTKFVPTLTSILNQSSDRIPPAMQSVALDMLETMVRMSVPPLGEALLTMAFPAVVQRTLNTEDMSTLQNGGECLRAFVSVSPEQILCYRDSEGRNGLHYVVRVAAHLLSPDSAEGTAAFVGKLITVLFKKMPDHIGDCLDQLLRAVLSKLQGAESLNVTESLILVYAHLMHSRLESVLTFLCSVPGPTGQTALAFVLTEWCSKQHLFFGSYERKVSAIALARLLEYGVTSNDQRLQSIVVSGDQVIDTSEPVTTRSQRVANPERWTQVPVVVKMFKLLIYELANAIDSTMGREDFNDSDEEEDDWSDLEMESCQEGNKGIRRALSDKLTEPWPGDTVDEDDDVDAMSDPLYAIELQKYLTNFIMDFALHPSYPAFLPHLNPHEKEVLQGIGLC